MTKMRISYFTHAAFYVGMVQSADGIKTEIYHDKSQRTLVYRRQIGGGWWARAKRLEGDKIADFVRDLNTNLNEGGAKWLDRYDFAVDELRAYL